MESENSRIDRAAVMLRTIDAVEGERTVGRRRADAAQCARDCGLTVGERSQEDAHPTVARVIAAADVR